ncbi:extracellular solute-binding protein [Streptomyces sp. YIM B13518]|uniref:extracellular solute-binding protein n=1 Tax=Streptomyces sp. YIM B13518 TaxID=3366316 RepID=UPI00367A3FC9
MTRKTRSATAAAIGLCVALAAAGCAGGDDGSGSSDGQGTVTLWTNAMEGRGAQFWKDAAKAYRALHPDVTIKIQSVQNEDLDGKLQNALNSNSAPDIFLQRGGGKMQAMVDAGQIRALELTDTDRANVGEATLEGVSIDGEVYAMPLDTQPEGIYCGKDLLKKAGITSTPTTMDELEDAVAKLKAIKVAPIAVGAEDAWPAAHWYCNFALRECSRKTMQEAAAIDGMSRLGFFFRMVVPLSLPGVVTVGILGFVGSWNNYLLPLYVLNSQANHTLPLGVQVFSSQYSTDTAKVLAFTSLAMLPALIFFSVFEKRIVGGLTGAVKG